jgi:hypothetical protein
VYNVLIYGPPGVGKLTVARELAQLTGFKLFDNHVTIDWARRFFDFGTPAFWQLNQSLRMAVIEQAIVADLSLISTFLEPSESVMAVVTPICERVGAAGGQCCFIQLICDRNVLEQRVELDERADAGKLASLDGLRRMLERSDLLAPAPGRDDLIIDNTDVSPVNAARRIAEHFALPLRS